MGISNKHKFSALPTFFLVKSTKIDKEISIFLYRFDIDIFLTMF